MDDPLRHLTMALEALLDRQSELDRLEIQKDDESERARIERWRETNLQAIDHLEQAIAGVPAGEARDAVFQVLIAAGRIQNLTAQACEPAVAEQLAVTDRLLRAALPALARSGGVDLAAHGGERYGQIDRESPFFKGSVDEAAG